MTQDLTKYSFFARDPKDGCIIGVTSHDPLEDVYEGTCVYQGKSDIKVGKYSPFYGMRWFTEKLTLDEVRDIIDPKPKQRTRADVEAELNSVLTGIESDVALADKLKAELDALDTDNITLKDIYAFNVFCASYGGGKDLYVLLPVHPDKFVLSGNKGDATIAWNERALNKEEMLDYLLRLEAKKTNLTMKIVEKE